jgi:hypothetical protein
MKHFVALAVRPKVAESPAKPALPLALKMHFDILSAGFLKPLMSHHP